MKDQQPPAADASPGKVFVAPGGRMRSIDVFRGFVLALMLFTPPVGMHWPMLRHAAWDGWTISDLVLPGFLFISGASLSFLLRAPVTRETKLRLIRRTIALLVLGVLYNAYGTVGADFSRVRLTGVLQLIGVSGAVATVIVLALRRPDGTDRMRAILAAAVLLPLLYGVGLAVFEGRCPDRVGCSPYHAVDATLVGSTHLYREGRVAYDPEGPVVMVAAAGLVLAGYLAGRVLRSARAEGSPVHRWFYRAGAAIIALGLLVDLIQPINKRLHTPAFEIFGIGVFVVLLGAFYHLLDRPVVPRGDVVERLRAGISHPFIVLGRNALIVYLAERFLLQTAANTLITTSSGEVMTVELWVLRALPIAGAGAELAYGGLLLATIVGLSYAMHALRWRIAL